MGRSPDQLQDEGSSRVVPWDSSHPKNGVTQGVEREGACCGDHADALPTMEVTHLRPGLGVTTFPSKREPRNGRNLALPPPRINNNHPLEVPRTLVSEEL